MAEEAEGLASAKPSAGADPAAISIALGAARSEPGTDETKGFLEAQRHLADLQAKELAHELGLRHWSLWVRHASGVLKLAFEFFLALILLALVAFFASIIWSAARDDDLVIEAFSVPPQLAQQGITGEVIAEDVTNRIIAIGNTAEANSIDATNKVDRGPDKDIKVEIPETGISLAELSQYLRAWLGHERHVGGNLRASADGRIALTVVLKGEGMATFGGAAADLGKLEQKASEYVFASADPINYAAYLLGAHRGPEALAAAGDAVRDMGTPATLAQAYTLWAYLTRIVTGDLDLMNARLRAAMSVDSKVVAPHMELLHTASLLSHDEEALRQARAIASFQRKDQPASTQGAGFDYIRMLAAFDRALLQGDYSHAAPVRTSAVLNDCDACASIDELFQRAEIAAEMHDVAQSRALLEEAVAAARTPDDLKPSYAALDDIQRVRYFSDAAAQDWQAAAADARASAEVAAPEGQSGALQAIWVQRQVLPLLAIALAKGSDFAGARAEIDETPDDCDLCIRARGEIEAAQKNYGGAAIWFARAAQRAPSIPFADAGWGRLLLDKGDPAAAIAKLTLANRKGPHFADPLETWGEALMAKNRSDLALAKFEEAAKYAPKWSRLHLKWGEALAYAGKADAAKRQFAIAAALAPAPAERTELDRIAAAHN